MGVEGGTVEVGGGGGGSSLMGVAGVEEAANGVEGTGVRGRMIGPSWPFWSWTRNFMWAFGRLFSPTSGR